MPKNIPSLKPRELIRLLEQGGCIFYREGKGDHRLYIRELEDTRRVVPIDMGAREMSPAYVLRIFRQFDFSDEEIEVVDKLATSKQIIAIEIDYFELTDAAWEMLDCLEAYLAKKLFGIVYAPEDGFYDEPLQPLYKLETPAEIG
jgi:predicted RNA binding protein YcfA (HicA-like mRNA interferase family)